MKILGLLLAAAALAAGIWYWRREPAHDVRPGAHDEAKRSPAAGGSEGDPARPRPALPLPATLHRAPVPGEPIAPPPSDVPATAAAGDSVPFDREVRDPAWAVDQERELKLRLDRVSADLAARGKKVKITSAECRRTLCRLEVAADASGDLSALYGALETPDGLYGWADTVVLGQVDGDLMKGGLTTTILVQFDRG